VPEPRSAGNPRRVEERPLERQEPGVRVAHGGQPHPVGPDPRRDRLLGDACALAPGPAERGEIREYQLFSVQWFPDSRHLLIKASSGDRWDFYRQSIEGGAPERVPALHGLEHALLNRNGDAVLGRTADGEWHSLPLSGGSPQIVPGLSRGDLPFGWSRDGRSVFAQRGEGRFERVDLATGRTLQSFTFGPSNRTGVNFMYSTSVINDGEGYAYSYYQRLSRAFRVDGVLR